MSVKTIAAIAVQDLANITILSRASALLHPLRLRVLALAREPASGTELARLLGMPRQRVNYHVRILERAGFLRPAGRVHRRNLIEQKYVATARSYCLSPELLGPLSPNWRAIEDAASGDYLLAVADQVRADVARAVEQAEAEGVQIRTLSLKAQFRFETPEQRARFTGAVRQAIVDVIARHSTPNTRENGRPGRGRPFRLVLACYPAPLEPEEAAR